jgi:hypothetical protein
MAEKNRQTDDYKMERRPDPSSAAAASPLPLRRVDILRAEDIIPGGPTTARPVDTKTGLNSAFAETSERPVSESENIRQVNIPQFDLAEDIMAEQRRLIAIRRKGPSHACPSSLVSHHSPTETRWTTDDGRWTNAERDPIIADIVARDIEWLCAGSSWA